MLFKCKYFDVMQRREVFKIGTDSILLGGVIEGNKDHLKILDVGTGTGILALIMAQKFPNSKVFAIENHPPSLEIATFNFKHSPFCSRLHLIDGDFFHFSTEEKFDVIICNPPYFKENRKFKHIVHHHARSSENFGIDEFLAHSKSILHPTGKIFFIYPKEQLRIIEQVLKKLSLQIHQKILVHHYPWSESKRVIFQVSSFDSACIESKLVMRDEKGKLSDAYLQVTGEILLN